MTKCNKCGEWWTAQCPTCFSGERASGSLKRAGWAVRGTRWNVEKEMTEHFRSPPEPHTYSEETAHHMMQALTELHEGWKWEVIPPNDGTKPRRD